MKHHWRFCPKDNIVRVWSDPFMFVNACLDCNYHYVQARKYVPFSFVRWWAKWVIRLFIEHDVSFRWWKVDEF